MIGVHWTVGSFFIFLLYIAGSILSWRTYSSLATRDHAEGSLWFIAAFLLCAMAANIAFGVLDRLTNAIRSGFEGEGWYSDRMVLQLQLTLALSLLSAVVISLALYCLRAIPMSSRLTFAVLTALMAFMLVRTVSLHAVDKILFARISGVTVSTVIETGTAALILLLISWRRAGRS